MINEKIIRVNIGGKAVYFHVLGAIDREFLDRVVEILSTAYRDLGETPDYLEVYVYESTLVKQEKLIREAIKIGVPLIGDYPVSHDAWSGWPRIHIDYEKCRGLSEKQLRALVYHEAGHSILHGSLSSYFISIKANRLNRFNLDPLEAIYLASVVVKDLDIHCFLSSRGLGRVIEDYFEYVKPLIMEEKCGSLREILEFSKLISPCVVINCTGLDEVLGFKCGRICESVIIALRHIVNLEKPLSTRIETFINELIEYTLH
jgi:hypothetical protein